jgi:hypothetical protein
MIAKWLRTAASWIGGRRKLIVVGFELPDQSSHYFNELLAYKSAAEALGLTPKIFVPRLAHPRLVAALGATPILDPLFQPADMAPERLGSELATCLSASETLGYLWDAIETEGLSQIRAIVFPQPNPAAIRATSLWLGRKRSGRVPDIFFRFVWGFDRPGPLSESHVLACHLAAKDLNTRPGHEHVFFLANSRGALSSIMRVCDRRAFMVPVPRLLTATATTSSTQSVRSTIYVHLNCRSAKLMDGLAEIVRRVKMADPRARFLIKFTLSAGTEAKSRLLDADIADSVEILPAEQSLEDYLANFLRCSIALLAYDPGPYATATSGVFVEAAALGRPVVVPADTWMAQELAAGRGVGRVFAEPTPSSVAAAVTEALQSYRQLSVAAQQLAPSLRENQSCQRLLERMLALTGQDLDMAPRYYLGEEIDFRDCYDSRCFMGKGWSVNESWGVWTEGSLAELSLRCRTGPTADFTRSRAPLLGGHSPTAKRSGLRLRPRDRGMDF